MATQVEILMRSAGVPDAPGTGGGKAGKAVESAADSAGKDSKTLRSAVGTVGKNLSASLGGAKKFFSKNLGIQMGLASVLKQSQVFTSFIGTIFQLVGALVDVILAPLLPIFFPLIRILAAQIPKAAKFGEWLAEKLLGWFEGIRKWYNGIKPMFDEKWAELKAAWDEGLGETIGVIGGFVGDGLGTLWTNFKDTGLPWIKDRAIEYANEFKEEVIQAFASGWAGVGKALTSSGLSIGKILTWITTKLVPKLLSLGWTGIKLALRTALPVVGHILTGIMDAGIWAVKKLGEGMWGLLKIAFTKPAQWIKSGFETLSLWTMILIDKLSAKLGDLPIIGRIFKALGRSTGFLKAAAQSTKAIPVLGAIATAGFGAVETYQVGRKYGWEAAVLTASKTAAATTLAAVGLTPMSLAVDLGGSLAVSQGAKYGAFGQDAAAAYRGDDKPINVNIHIGQNPQEQIVMDLKNTDGDNFLLLQNLDGAMGNS